MNSNKLLATLLLIGTQAFSTSFTFGESIELDNEKELIILVHKNQEYCAEEISDGKIYLKPEHIYPTKEGVFLRLDQFSLAKLLCICSDEKGCYIKENFE